jgi:SSS family solute:Na+ symporter
MGGLVIPGYIGLYALLVNCVVAIVANGVVRILGMTNNRDATLTIDYAG